MLCCEVHEGVTSSLKTFAPFLLGDLHPHTLALFQVHSHTAVQLLRGVPTHDRPPSAVHLWPTLPLAPNVSEYGQVIRKRPCFLKSHALNRAPCTKENNRENTMACLESFGSDVAPLAPPDLAIVERHDGILSLYVAFLCLCSCVSEPSARRALTLL